MTEICISTAFIVIAAAWYFAARRCHTLPQGLEMDSRSDRSRYRSLRWLRRRSLRYDTAIYDWCSAFVNVALVLLHLLAACIMSLLLWTVDRTIWVQLSIRGEPEEQQARH